MRTNNAFTTYRRHRTNLDAGGGWRLTNHYSLSVSARNLLNTPYVNMQKFGNNAAVITRSEVNGISYTFAVTGPYANCGLRISECVFPGSAGVSPALSRTGRSPRAPRATHEPANIFQTE